MNKMTGNMLKGVGIGLAAGMTAGIVGTMFKTDGKQMKKTGRHAIQAMEDVLDRAMNMLK